MVNRDTDTPSPNYSLRVPAPPCTFLANQFTTFYVFLRLIDTHPVRFDYVDYGPVLK